MQQAPELQIFDIDPMAAITGGGSLENATFFHAFTRSMTGDNAAGCTCMGCGEAYAVGQYPTVGVKIGVPGETKAIYGSICSRCSHGRGRKSLLGMIAKAIDVQMTDLRPVSDGPRLVQ